MPGDNNTSTSTNSSTTWMNQPGFKEVLGTAKNVFDQGTAFRPFTGSMVTPFSTQTKQGLTGMQSTATGAVNPFTSNFNRVNATLNDGGLNTLQDQQVGRLQGVASGTGLNAQQQQAYNALTPTGTGMNAQQLSVYNRLNPTASGLNAQQNQQYNRLNQIAGGTGYNNEQQKALDWLGQTASGNPASNPFLDDIIKRTSDDIRLQEGLSASAMGRYGSGGHAGALADKIGDMSSALRYQDYNTQQGRKDNAIRDFANLGTTGMGQKMGAIGAAADLGTTGAAQRFGQLGAQGNLATTGMNQRTNALGQQFNMGTTGQNQRMDAIGSLYNAGGQQRQNLLAGTDQLRDAYDARLDPYRTMTSVGSAYEGQMGDILKDQYRVFNENKNSITDPVNWLANLAASWRGGQQINQGSSTVPDTGPSPWQSAIGGGLGAYGATGNPWLGLMAGASRFL